MRISQDQNSFVYCCNNCTNQLVSSPSACRYHCIFCDDFDLCLRCFQSSRHQHRLEKMDFNPTDESPSASNNSNLNIYDSPEGREAAVQRCLDTLVHAIRCRGFDCNLTSCRRIKQLFVHRRLCQRRIVGSCGVCKQTTRLLYLHGVRCQESQCPAPFCSVIKDRVRRQRLILRMRTIMANRPLAFRTAFRAAASRPANQTAGLAGGSRSSVTNQTSSFSPRLRLAALRTATATRVALATLRTAAFHRPGTNSSTSREPSRIPPPNTATNELQGTGTLVTIEAGIESRNRPSSTVTVPDQAIPTDILVTTTARGSSSTSIVDSLASPIASISRASVSVPTTHTDSVSFSIYTSPEPLTASQQNPPALAFINETVLDEPPCPGPSSRHYSPPQPNLGCGRGRPAPVIARCKMMYEADDSGEETERIEMSSDSEPEDMPLSELKGRTHK